MVSSAFDMTVGWDIDLSSGDIDLDSAGDIAKVFGVDAINQELYLLSYVTPRTLLFHVNWGLGIPALVGQTFSDQTSQTIAAQVAQGYLVLPAVQQVVSVDVTMETQGQVTVTPVVQLVGGAIQPFALTLPTGGTA